MNKTNLLAAYSQADIRFQSSTTLFKYFTNSGNVINFVLGSSWSNPCIILAAFNSTFSHSRNMGAI